MSAAPARRPLLGQSELANFQRAITDRSARLGCATGDRVLAPQGRKNLPVVSSISSWAEAAAVGDDPPHHRSKPTLYSITSSARASSVGGTSRPSALAVLRLMTSSYFTGDCTGRSA